MESVSYRIVGLQNIKKKLYAFDCMIELIDGNVLNALNGPKHYTKYTCNIHCVVNVFDIQRNFMCWSWNRFYFPQWNFISANSTLNRCEIKWEWNENQKWHPHIHTILIEKVRIGVWIFVWISTPLIRILLFP